MAVQLLINWLTFKAAWDAPAAGHVLGVINGGVTTKLFACSSYKLKMTWMRWWKVIYAWINKKTGKAEIVEQGFLCHYPAPYLIYSAIWLMLY